MQCNKIFENEKLSFNPMMNAPKSKGRVFEQPLGKYFHILDFFFATMYYKYRALKSREQLR